MMMWINESEIAPYLRDVRKYKVLSAAEEEELIVKIKDGCEKSAELLIKSNLRFVIKVAKGYQNRGLDFPDLINEGNYGLIKASLRFDSTVGVRFYSYAVHWIRQAILQALNEHARTIRLPVNVINEMIKNRKTMTEQEYGDWCVYQGVNRTWSLNQPCTEDGEELGNTIAIDDDLAFAETTESEVGLSSTLVQVMDILSPREKIIISEYYGLDGEELTLQQIADNLDLTKERVRQIKNQAIKKLRFNAPSLFKFFEG